MLQDFQSVSSHLTRLRSKGLKRKNKCRTQAFPKQLGYTISFCSWGEGEFKELKKYNFDSQLIKVVSSREIQNNFSQKRQLFEAISSIHDAATSCKKNQKHIIMHRLTLKLKNLILGRFEELLGPYILKKNFVELILPTQPFRC